MNDKYILDAQGQPQVCDDLLTWASWFETADRKVLATEIAPGVRVSTIFLGLDHRFGSEEGSPILWETMVFGGPEDGTQFRYTRRIEAEVHHDVIVARLRNGLPIPDEMVPDAPTPGAAPPRVFRVRRIVLD